MTNPDKVAFSLFGRDIYWFAVLLIIGGVCAVIASCIFAKRKKTTSDEVIDLALWTIPLSLIFARVYFVLCNLGDYASNPVSMLYIWNGGLALPGAILGGALGIFIYSRIRKRRFLRYADVLIPGVLLVQAIGRWGDFFNQMSYGPQITDAGLLWFPMGVLIDSTGTCHYALFFYECLWCLILFAVVLMMYKHFRHDGDMMLFYLFFYSLERMMIEQYRVDSLMVGGVRITQVVCAIVVVSVAAFVLVRYLAEHRRQALIWPAPEPEEPENKYSDMEKTTAQTLEDQAADVDPTPDESEVPDFVADRDDFRKFGVTLPEESKSKK